MSKDIDTDSQEYKNMIKGFEPLISKLQELVDISLDYYTPIVDDIIRNKVKDKNTIEHTFDGILDIAHDDRALALYKRLARYYYTIDEEGTLFYINAYREMLDSEVNHYER